jgi:hypothetical protein
MSLGVSRTTDPLRFDTGIGHAGYAEIMDSPAPAPTEGSLLPGTTTVTESMDSLFPVDKDVSAGIMRALVSDNPSAFRTQSGFGAAALSSVHSLRGAGTPVAEAAAAEIDSLLADIDLLDRYRMALLET